MVSISYKLCPTLDPALFINLFSLFLSLAVALPPQHTITKESTLPIMVSKNILSIRLQTLNYLSLLRKKVFLNAILCFTKSLQCIRQNAFILIFSITSLSKGFLTKKLLPPLQLFTSEFLFDSFSMCNDYMKVHYY